jgi:hypothetical protein
MRSLVISEVGTVSGGYWEDDGYGSSFWVQSDSDKRGLAGCVVGALYGGGAYLSGKVAEAATSGSNTPFGSANLYGTAVSMGAGCITGATGFAGSAVMDWVTNGTVAVFTAIAGGAADGASQASDTKTTGSGGSVGGGSGNMMNLDGVDSQSTDKNVSRSARF